MRLVRRLLPSPSDQVDLAEAYGVTRRRNTDGRPWLGVCMVASLDGSTVVAGRSAALSSETDGQVVRALRAAADVVLVGAGTVRDEGYGPPRTTGQRIAVVTRSGRVDPTSALFTSGAGLLVTTEDADLPPGVDAIECIRAGRGSVDLRAALHQLDATFVHAEGGPTLNGALVAADLIDELNLTLSPQLVGGTGPRLTDGAPDVAQAMTLAHLLEEDGFLFSRWVRST